MIRVEDFDKVKPQPRVHFDRGAEDYPIRDWSAYGGPCDDAPPGLPGLRCRRPKGHTNTVHKIAGLTGRQEVHIASYERWWYG